MIVCTLRQGSWKLNSKWEHKYTLEKQMRATSNLPVQSQTDDCIRLSVNVHPATLNHINFDAFDRKIPPIWSERLRSNRSVWTNSGSSVAHVKSPRADTAEGRKVEGEKAQSKTRETRFTPEIMCCSVLVDLMNPARYKSSRFGPRTAAWAFRRREITVNTAGRGLDPLCLDTKTAYLERCVTLTPSLTLSARPEHLCTALSCILYIFLNHLQRAASTWKIQR